MASSGKLDVKMNAKKILRPENESIRHDPAETWGFRYGLTLGIGNLKIKASTAVFVRLVCAFKRPISRASRTSSITLT